MVCNSTVPKPQIPEHVKYNAQIFVDNLLDFWNYSKRPDKTSQALELNLNIYTSGKIEFHQSINGL